MDSPNSRRQSSGLLMGGKYCAKCGAFKDLEEYHRDATRPDGRKTRCKPCRVEDIYQAQMRKKLKLGNTQIRACKKCDLLHMSPDIEEKHCPKCR